MYDEIGVFATTGVLRRTSAEGVPADGDHWYEQGYNYARFPLSMDKYHPDRSYAFSDTVDFSQRSEVKKHGVRGVEYSTGNTCASTIDTSSTFAFKVAKMSKSTIRVTLDYEFANADAGVGAAMMVGTVVHPIPAQTKRSVSHLEFTASSQSEIIITLFHPNAVPEHDLGNQRYDFRRMGMNVFSMSVIEIGDVTNATRPAKLRSMLSAAFGRS